MKIVILDGHTINPGDLSWSEIESFGKVTVYERTAPELIVPRIGNAEIILTSKCCISAEVMSQCAQLKYIGILATGINMVDLNYAASHRVQVTSIPAYSTDSVAQLTFSLLLEICNQVRKHCDAVDSGMWQNSKDFCFSLTPQTELSGKTLGIIGFGNIGKRVAKISEAFGMNVVISSNYPDSDFITDRIRFSSLDKLYSDSDIISLHCPLTEDNKGFINHESISKMKDGVIIINTSRGPLIRESDLACALQSGKVSAAGLDVLSVEPPKESHPLIGLKNCFITPHIAWITKESRVRLIHAAAANLEAFLHGEVLNGVN
jgi:Lactate dehydrogenase and related dehydrogenases